MKKAVFFCKNVDFMSTEEITLCESLLKIGFETKIYSQDDHSSDNDDDEIKQRFRLSITECDLMILSTDKENGIDFTITGKT